MHIYVLKSFDKRSQPSFCEFSCGLLSLINTASVVTSFVDVAASDDARR